MRAIITVFKSELAFNAPIIETIRETSAYFMEASDAYTFSPKPGKLFVLLNLLKENNISYRTHFDVADDISSTTL